MTTHRSVLTTGVDITRAARLTPNLGIAFQGVTPGGPFDISHETAQVMLASPNPDGRSSADVIRPWINAADLVGRARGMWVIDFPPGTPERQAALYEAPFAYVLEHVKSQRDSSRTTTSEWWIHERPRVEMRGALKGLSRYLATPAVAKHRIFVWVSAQALCENAVVVFARDDDYTLGVLQSSIHEVWSRRTGTQLRERESGFRYTPTTTFETFPFPTPTDAQRRVIEEASRSLVALRDGWLRVDCARTFTGLYNESPTWLSHAGHALDAAVAAAYGWPELPAEDEILRRLLALNEARSRA